MVITALVLLAFAMSRAEAEGGTVLVGGPGSWTLERLGAGELTLSPRPLQRAGRVAMSTSIPVAFPVGARQGPEQWYVVDLRFQLALRSDSRAGYAYVTALLNGAATVQVEFAVKRVAGALRTRWSTVGLVQGFVEHMTSARRIEVVYANYVPYRGIRPGEGNLTIQVEQLGHVRVDSVRVYADSAIVVDDRSPPNAVLDVHDSPGASNAGEPFHLPFRLQNTGERPLLYAHVRVDPLPAGIRVVGPSAVRFGPVAPRSGVSGQFTLRAERPGKFMLGAAATTSANQPGDELLVTVAPATPGGGAWGARGVVLIAAALFGAATVAAAVVLRRRQRPTSPQSKTSAR